MHESITPCSSRFFDHLLVMKLKRRGIEAEDSGSSPAAHTTRPRGKMVLVGCLGRSVAPDELGDYRRFIGLKNQGNTCHLNVILQALFMTPELREGLLEVCSTVDPKSVAPLPRSLAALFHRLATGSRPCSTGPITKSLRGYGMNRQQDCHDTYLLLCARLETDLKGTSQSLLTQELFQGKQRDYVKCHACQHTSFTEDLFSNLSINLPNVPARTAASSDRQGRESSERDDESAADDVTDTTGDPAGEEIDDDTTPSVRTALRATLAPEQLVGDDQYECDKCKCKRDAERGVRLSVLPPVRSHCRGEEEAAPIQYILVIHLKRFATSYERDKRGRVKLKLTKLNLALHVDRTLDMREFVAPIEADLAVPEYGEGDKATATSGASETEAVYSCTSEPLSLGEADDGRESCQPVSVVGLSDGMSSGLVSETEAQEAESEGDRSMLYELYGVLIHAGSLEKGHYFALIKDIETDEWYRFDDEKVSRLPTNRLDAELRRSHGGDGASASAYMLLYRSKADRGASTTISPNGSPRSDAHEHVKSPSSMIMSTSEEGVAVSASPSRNTHLFVEGDVEGDDISARIDTCGEPWRQTSHFAGVPEAHAHSELLARARKHVIQCESEDTIALIRELFVLFNRHSREPPPATV